MKEELEEDIKNTKCHVAAKLQKVKIQLARTNEEKHRLEADISVLQNEHQRLAAAEVILNDAFLYLFPFLLVL